MGVSNLLRRSPVFAGFDDEMLERIAAPFSQVDFAPEQVLIEPRTPGAGLFVICEGSVIAESPGKRRELGAGDVVGEISLLEEDGLRRARVVAKTHVTCLALGRADFERLLEAEPEFADTMRDLARNQLAELEGSG
jgi:CRP/FNR family transcriptional regulator, cyclic AMP receptor protein